jgi:hypothetical protein
MKQRLVQAERLTGIGQRIPARAIRAGSCVDIDEDQSRRKNFHYWVVQFRNREFVADLNRAI